MSRGFRTFLFIFFLAVFLVAAPAVVFYAQGYRINWPLEPGKKPIVMTGGFFVKASPKQIDIYVDGKLAKQTDFFFDQALAQNLLPKTHKFEIKKTGYHSWEKNLEIKEKEVTEVRNLVLFPEKIALSELEKNIVAALPAPDKKSIALRQSDRMGWSLKLYDIGQGLTLKLANQSNFSAKDPDLKDWRWTNDKNLEVVIAETAGATSTYAIAAGKNPAQITKMIPAAIKNPANATTTDDLKEKEIGGVKYVLAADGYLREIGQNQTREKKLAAALPAKPGEDCDFWIFGNYYLAKVNADLFTFNQESNSFEKIVDNFESEPVLSPDGKKIALCSNSEIWIFYLKSKPDPPPADAGSRIFIARLSEKIAACDWFNSEYLAFAAGKNIKIAEIDTRDKVNLIDLLEIPAGQNGNENQTDFFLDRDKKTFYLLASGILYKSAPVE